MGHTSPLFEHQDTAELVTAPSRVASSELAPTLLPRTVEPLFNPALSQEINRTGIAATKGDKAVPTDAQRGFAQSKVGALAPLSAGLAAGGATDFQTTDPLEAGIGVGLGVGTTVLVVGFCVTKVGDIVGNSVTKQNTVSFNKISNVFNNGIARVVSFKIIVVILG